MLLEDVELSGGGDHLLAGGNHCNFSGGRTVFCAVASQIRDIFENVPPFNVTIEPENPAAKPVEFTTSDGLCLRGSLLNSDVPDPAGLVLFLPELRGNHWMASKYCEALLNDGFVVLSFDFRNQGTSDSMPGIFADPLDDRIRDDRRRSCSGICRIGRPSEYPSDDCLRCQSRRCAGGICSPAAAIPGFAL